MSLKKPSEPPSGPGARALLDDLDRVDFSLRHNRSLLDLVEEAVGKGDNCNSVSSKTSRPPVRSPEAAEQEHHLRAALTKLSSDSIEEARKRAADLERRRLEILAEMAECGCFEGRWVGNGDRAVYLEKKVVRAPEGSDESEESQEKEESHFELHEGPWAWVENAPEGEDPRETLTRSKILDRRMQALNELCLLVGMPVAVAIFGSPLVPGLLLLPVVAATTVVLLLYLPRGRERIFDYVFFGVSAERRKAQEMAALTQLDSLQRGVTDVPSLDELEKDFAHELAWQRSESISRLLTANEQSATTEKTAKTEESSGEGSSDEESQESQEPRDGRVVRRS